VQLTQSPSLLTLPFPCFCLDPPTQLEPRVRRSVVVVKMKSVGYNLTTDELFWLTALPSLSGATLRIAYVFMPAKFGGRLWTMLTTASLVVPTVGMAMALQKNTTPFGVFTLLGLLAGLGGGCFSSSMVNISYFYPKAQKGNALAINAGFGNLGVSVVQFLVPFIIKAGSMFGSNALSGTDSNGVATTLWLANAGWIFVPFAVAGALASWVWMDDLATMKSSFTDQRVIFSRLHCWTMCWLYTGTFGSFIGFSSAFPLLTKVLFPDIDPLKYAFLGPLVGSLARAVAGSWSDRYGGGRITFVVLIGAICCVIGIIDSVHSKENASFPIFMTCFMFLFAFCGFGNASTYQMIPVITRLEVARLHPALKGADLVRQGDMESAAIVGFASAMGAYGGFIIPMSFGASITHTGSAAGALYGFIGFYVTCVAVNWWYFTRPAGLLYAIERKLSADVAAEHASKGFMFQLFGYDPQKDLGEVGLQLTAIGQRQAGDEGGNVEEKA